MAIPVLLLTRHTRPDLPPLHHCGFRMRDLRAAAQHFDCQKQHGHGDHPVLLVTTDDSAGPDGTGLRTPTEGTGPSGLRDLSTSARDAVRSRGATLRRKRHHSHIFSIAPLIDSLAHAAPHQFYFCWPSPSSPRAQRKPVPWVCSANPPRPLAEAVMSASGLCHEPPRIERTTPFLSGPCGFRPGACL